MTALNVVLERFDDTEKALSGIPPGGENDARAQQEHVAAYAEGYAAGEAAAQAKAQPQVDFLKSVAEVLESKVANFQGQADASLCDGLAAILSKVFPALSKKGFATEAASVLAQTRTGPADVSITVKTAPDHIALLRDAVADLGEGARIIVEEDAELSGAMVVAEWDNGGMDFDTNKVIEQCLAALEKAAHQLRDGNDNE
jgi:flagellar biosynthesis/type III secretory pathway protein FliH